MSDEEITRLRDMCEERAKKGVSAAEALGVKAEDAAGRVS